MPTFNLLPSELAPKSSYRKLVGVLKKIIIIGYSFLFISIIVAIVIFFMLSRGIKNEIDIQNDLVISIEALEETEQKLILVQDRLSKVNVVLDEKTMKEEAIALKELILVLPDTVLLKGLILKEGGIDFSAEVRGSSGLTELLSVLISTNYREIYLNSFKYSQGKYESAISIRI